jgi:predicted TIM-barrel fold metal-dependent hydrolase
MSLIDTHIHVFVGGLPLAPVRRYVPDYDATVDDYRKRMEQHGISHAVLVQPSFLGTDNSFMCEALRRHRRTLRGIAVVDPAIDEGALDALQADGVVGIRLNLDSLPIPDFARGPWPRLVSSLVRRGWQVEVHREARDLPRIVGPLLEAGVNVVVDHFGRPDDDLGVDDAGFRYMLEQGATRRLWVKVSAPYRNGAQGRGLATAAKAIPLLVDRLGIDRLVWGSDWPHTRHESYRSIATAIGELDAWFPDPEQRAQVAGANALALFKFDAADVPR